MTATEAPSPRHCFSSASFRPRRAGLTSTRWAGISIRSRAARLAARPSPSARWSRCSGAATPPPRKGMRIHRPACDPGRPALSSGMGIDKLEFIEQLLQVMEGKSHWAWPLFTSGQVARERLHVHFEQEYETYVRDFPVLVGRAYVQCPVAEVRRELAENVYEEETGGLIAGRPHPELFL